MHRGEKESNPVWLCGSVGCGQPYDSKVLFIDEYANNKRCSQDIEAMLVDVIQRKLMGHCLQDLVCAKCKEVN